MTLPGSPLTWFAFSCGCVLVACGVAMYAWATREASKPLTDFDLRCCAVDAELDAAALAMVEAWEADERTLVDLDADLDARVFALSELDVEWLRDNGVKA